ncbi:MAG: T-complex 10 C-terminal domain-containing protein, partial [Proteobacteria bacterium]|nr:T-complex 10 C-terminal domain-containing protein [Pseudomonadota bacterium]
VLSERVGPEGKVVAVDPDGERLIIYPDHLKLHTRKKGSLVKVIMCVISDGINNNKLFPKK